VPALSPVHDAAQQTKVKPARGGVLSGEIKDPARHCAVAYVPSHCGVAVGSSLTALGLAPRLFDGATAVRVIFVTGFL
jgi:hypothetical protein